MAGSLHANGTHTPLRSHLMQNTMPHHHMLSNGTGQQESTNYMMTTPSTAATHPHHHIQQPQQQLKPHCSQQQQPHWGNEIVHGIPDNPARSYYKSEESMSRLQHQQQQQQDNNVQYKYNGNLVREVSFNVGIEVESCVNAGSFTNVHYTRPPNSMDGMNSSSTPGDQGFPAHEELRSREDSLDLYSSFRDDSYSENSDDFSNESGEAGNRFQSSIGAPMHTVNQAGMNFPVSHGQQQQMHMPNIYPESDYFNVNHTDYHSHSTASNQITHQPYPQHQQSYTRQPDTQHQFSLGNIPPHQEMYSAKPSDFINGYHNHAQSTVGVPSSCLYTSASQPLGMCGQQQQPICQPMSTVQQQQTMSPMGFHPSGTNSLMDGTGGHSMMAGYSDVNTLGHYGKMDPYGVPTQPANVMVNGENKSSCKVYQVPPLHRDDIGTANGSTTEGEKSSSDEDGLTENFGEIIKKSMVETVSA